MRHTHCPKCGWMKVTRTHIAQEQTLRCRCLACFHLWREEPLYAPPPTREEPVALAPIIVLREPHVA